MKMFTCVGGAACSGRQTRPVAGETYTFSVWFFWFAVVCRHLLHALLPHLDMAAVLAAGRGLFAVHAVLRLPALRRLLHRARRVIFMQRLLRQDCGALTGSSMTLRDGHCYGRRFTSLTRAGHRLLYLL